MIFDWSKLSDSRVTDKSDSLCLRHWPKRQFREKAKQTQSDAVGAVLGGQERLCEGV